MTFDYDVRLPSGLIAAKGRPTSKETLLVKEFLDGPQRNLCLRYDTEKNAQGKYSTVHGWLYRHGYADKVKVARRNKTLYVIKIEEATT